MFQFFISIIIFCASSDVLSRHCLAQITCIVPPTWKKLSAGVELCRSSPKHGWTVNRLLSSSVRVACGVTLSDGRVAPGVRTSASDWRRNVRNWPGCRPLPWKAPERGSLVEPASPRLGSISKINSKIIAWIAKVDKSFIWAGRMLDWAVGSRNR